MQNINKKKLERKINKKYGTKMSVLLNLMAAPFCFIVVKIVLSVYCFNLNWYFLLFF